MGRSFWTQLVHFPGSPLLLNDVEGEPEVVTQPRQRVLSRWVVFLLLIAALAGLMASSYITSSELSSGVVVNREFEVKMEDVQKWTSKNYSFTCPCSGLTEGTIAWLDIMPQSVWPTLDQMKTPQRYPEDPNTVAFCTSNALLGRDTDTASCTREEFVNDLGFNIPSNPRRGDILAQYPGVMLQAPACRSVAGALHHLRYTGFPSRFLLSQAGLNETAQAVLRDVIYSTSGNVQSQIMTRWSFDDMAPDYSDALNDAWNAFYPDTGAECNGNASCANEGCLLDYFARYISNITLDYPRYYELCQPEVCDVMQPKSAVTRVVDFLSTLGGLWGPLFSAAMLLWYLVSRLPVMSSEHRGDVAMRLPSKSES